MVEVIISQNPKRNKSVGDFDYDFCINGWGHIKECNIGDYPKIFAIKVNDRERVDEVKNLILGANWREIYPMTNVTNLLQWQIHKFVGENVKNA